MADWGDTPPTFDRSGDAWGARGGGFDIDGEGGGDQYIELIGSNLWVAGMVNLGRFRRVSDFVNIVQGYLVIRDAVVMSRTGEATRLAIPELRVLPDDIAVVAQIDDDKGSAGPGAGGASTGGTGGAGAAAVASGGMGAGADSTLVIEKHRQRLVVMTRTHLIDGDVFIHGDGTIMAFVDATDPKFIPMSDVRVRWMSDRKLAARYPFALLQRSQILGVATEGIKLGGAEQTMRRAALLKAQSTAGGGGGSDGLGDEIGSTVPVAEASGAGAAAAGDELEEGEATGR